jgi:SPP1 family predicted phage head-tail adaptor
MIRKSRRQNIGELDKRMKLVYNTTVSDGMGGLTPTQTDLFTTWASVKPVSAKRLLEIDRAVQNTTHQIRFRWRDDLAPLGYVRNYIDNQLRGVFNNRLFTINTVINVDEDDFLVDVLATEESYDIITTFDETFDGTFA